jgi:transcriptional regulator with XRE-family HTH domain
MDFQDQVGARLRHLREAKGMSRREVQEASQNTIKESILAMYESGRRRIPTPRLKEIADFYGSSLSFLMGESVSPIPTAAGVPDVEAMLKSDPKYSDEERELLLHVMGIIKAKRRAEGRE